MSSKTNHTNNHGPFLSADFLRPYVESFSKNLYDRGFTQLTVKGYVDSVSYFGTWLTKKEIALQEIDIDLVTQFENHRCYCPGTRKSRSISHKYSNRVRKFVSYL